MIGDRERSITIESYLDVRAFREEYFPVEMFGEFGWGMLLQLFLALAENQTLTENQLFERADVSPLVGRRWLQYLATRELVIIDTDGDDVRMTPASINAMRKYIDRVQAKVAGRD